MVMVTHLVVHAGGYSMLEVGMCQEVAAITTSPNG